MDKEIHDVPSQVVADDGNVSVEGPDGVSVCFTPDAAEETSNRLFDAAAEAGGQRHVKALREHEAHEKEAPRS